MKKLEIAIVASLIVVAGIIAATSASALDWNDYFDTPIFDSSLFDESDVIEDEKQELPKRLTNFPPDWFNETPREELTNFPPDWFNETPREELTNFPPDWFNETPREEYTNKPPGWFEVNSELF